VDPDAIADDRLVADGSAEEVVAAALAASLVLDHHGSTEGEVEEHTPPSHEGATPQHAGLVATARHHGPLHHEHGGHHGVPTDLGLGPEHAHLHQAVLVDGGSRSEVGGSNDGEGAHLGARFDGRCLDQGRGMDLSIGMDPGDSPSQAISSHRTRPREDAARHPGLSQQPGTLPVEGALVELREDHQRRQPHQVGPVLDLVNHRCSTS